MILGWLAAAALAEPVLDVGVERSASGPVLVVDTTDPALSNATLADAALTVAGGGLRLSEPLRFSEDPPAPTWLVTVGAPPAGPAWTRFTRDLAPLESRVSDSRELDLALAGPLMPRSRVILVAADGESLTDATVAPAPFRTGRTMISAMVVATPEFGGAFDPLPGLRSVVEGTGGVLIIADNPSEAERRLPELIAVRQVTLRAPMSLCHVVTDGRPTLVVQRTDQPDGPDRPLNVPDLAVPPCPEATTDRTAPAEAAVSPDGASRRPTSLRRWWTAALALLGMGLAIAAVGWVFLRKRGPSPPPQPVSAPTVGTLRQPRPQPGAASAPSLQIVVGHGLEGQIIPLQSTVLTMGSDPDSDVMIELPGVARHHARFECFPGGTVMVMDGRSGTGTRVDDDRLGTGEKRRLRDGSRIGLGPALQLVFRIGDGP